MELIPVINFEALNNPSFSSRIISLFEFDKLSPAHRLWKWGAFLLAFVYAFNYVTNKLRTLILHYHNKSKSFLINAQPLLSPFDDEFCTSDDEDDVVSVSSDVADESDEEEERELNRLLSDDDLSKFDHDFSVKGQKRKFRVLRRRKSLGDDFSLSDLVNGDEIVKLWDGFGFGFGVEKTFPFLELNKDEWKKIGSFFGSPEVLTTGSGSGDGEPGGLGLSVWDFRCSKTESAVHATWRSDRMGKVVGLDQTGKVCVRDDVMMGMTVGDVRMIEAPLEDETEMWWDADV